MITSRDIARKSPGDQAFFWRTKASYWGALSSGRHYEELGLHRFENAEHLRDRARDIIELEIDPAGFAVQPLSFDPVVGEALLPDVLGDRGIRDDADSDAEIGRAHV